MNLCSFAPLFLKKLLNSKKVKNAKQSQFQKGLNECKLLYKKGL